MILYNRDWPENFSQLDIELACFRHRLTPAQGGLGALQHFINVCEILWPEGNRRHLIWHPWAIRMISEALRLQELPNGRNNLSVAGAASAGKSVIFGALAIVMWLCDPENTKVFVTSTTLKQSRNRIWGVISEMYSHAEAVLPGKMVDSTGTIRTHMPGKPPTDMAGITLIAGEKKNDKKAIDKLIGVKANWVLMIADEMTALSPALLAASANLDSNPHYQCIGLGNASSIWDCHGTMSEPKNGWKSVDVENLDGWETKTGYCLRFDAEQSPNYIEGRDVYPFMPNRAKVDQAKEQFGEKSRSYYRMYRSIWFGDDEDEGAFSEADMLRTDARRTDVKWYEPPTPVAGLDPAFSNGGDRTVLIYGLYGEDIDHVPTLLITGHDLLTEDASIKDKPRAFQIAEQVRDKCAARGIDPRNLGMDTTGGGASLYDVLTFVWKPGVLPVVFGGWPSDRVVGEQGNRRSARDVYANKASEMWGETRRYIVDGQLCGVFNALAQELTTRKFVNRQRGSNTFLAIETKESLRKRTGKSCDIADAALVMVDLCRARFKFRNMRIKREKFDDDPFRPDPVRVRSKWRKLVDKVAAVHTSPLISEDRLSLW